MVRRHPHVFGDARDLSPAEVKAALGGDQGGREGQRRAARAKAGGRRSRRLLAGVPVDLPALTRAEKLTRKAATGRLRLAAHGGRRRQDRGGDWPRSRPKLAAGGDRDRIEDEIGDLLFAVANLARHHGVDPEKALRRTNAKFVRRFAAIEAGLAAQGKTAAEASLDEMEGHWQRAKEAG